MFDLPTDTPQARKDYTFFRKNLLTDGFSLFQYSVYARHCSSKENAEAHSKKVENFLPPGGQICVLTVTDKQFERMKMFWGNLRKPPKPAPKQLLLFG